MWDIDGRLVDLRGFIFRSITHGDVQPGMPVHQMLIRMTIDVGMVIRAVALAVDNTPFPTCPEAAENYQQLVGLKISGGFVKRMRELVGRREGCTHLSVLIEAMAKVAVQTANAAAMRRIGDERAFLGDAEGMKQFGQRSTGAHGLINSCHTYAEDGTLVRNILSGSHPGMLGAADPK